MSCATSDFAVPDMGKRHSLRPPCCLASFALREVGRPTSRTEAAEDFQANTNAQGISAGPDTLHPHFSTRQ
jgi:hypothetical protein